jgi:5-methylcytosine-specific restriction protein B
MGDNLYTDYWQSTLPQIIEQFKSGKQLIQIPVKELSNFGNRLSYYVNFRIVNGKLEKQDQVFPQGRDLYTVMVANDFLKEELSDKTFQVTITKNLLLKIEVLDIAAPDFFTEEDFEQLVKAAKQIKVAGNDEDQKTYDYLKVVYAKTAYWAREVQKKLFPDGSMQVLRKPTNQANRFESYHWAKIYPDKIASDYSVLAYTVGFSADNEFIIKIDTVGLHEADNRRKEYLQFRGDFRASKIVKILSKEQVLDKGWKYLIDLSSNIINTFQPAYNSLFQSFQIQAGNEVPGRIRKRIFMPLNIIFYGPPGTGKTYQLQSLFKEFIIRKAVQTKEEFLSKKIRELTWWQTIAAAIVQLKKSTVPELEKHPFIQIKASQSSTLNLKQILWGQLQYHADPECKHVKFARRSEPYLFSKNETSTWSIIDDRVKTEAPEIIDFLNETNTYKPTPKSTQKNYQMVTFHQSFSYEDFVEGIKPVISEEVTDEVQYEIQRGVFYNACNDAVKLVGYNSLKECMEDDAKNRKDKFLKAPEYALFIDEINRANISSVLGELITLLEDDKRLGKENEITDIVLPYSKTCFGIPANLYIIGTMNTADRSVEALDTALRRRFVFEAMLPDAGLLNSFSLLKQLWITYRHTYSDDEEWLTAEEKFMSLFGMDFIDKGGYENLKPDEEGNVDEVLSKLNPDSFKEVVQFKNGIDLEKLLRTVNERLEVLLDKDHTIGHAWLMNVLNMEELKAAFSTKILPLLQEFFYNDYAKIGLVLGKNFVEQKEIKRPFAKFDEELASEYEEKKIYILKDVEQMTIEDFKSIYE